MGPSSNMIGVLKRRGGGNIAGECHAMRWCKQRLEWSCCKTWNNKEWQPPQEARERQERIIPSTVFRENMALLTPWFWTSSFQNCETTDFCSFKSPSLYCFVTAPKKLTCYSLTISLSYIRLYLPSPFFLSFAHWAFIKHQSCSKSSTGCWMQCSQGTVLTLKEIRNWEWGRHGPTNR